MRARILREAARLFASRGFAATSVRDVAEAVGCTKPALYYHFASKADLFAAIVHEQNELISSLVERSLRSSGSLRERMAGGLAEYFSLLKADPLPIRLLMMLERSPRGVLPDMDLGAMRQHHVELLSHLIAEGVRAGEVRADVDVRDAALALVGIIDLRLQLWLEGEELPADLAQRVIHLLFDGVAP